MGAFSGEVVTGSPLKLKMRLSKISAKFDEFLLRHNSKIDLTGGGSDKSAHNALGKEADLPPLQTGCFRHGPDVGILEATG
jgi:hypothetical protein